MTHIPSGKECRRGGKLSTVCGREISARKMVSHHASCVECDALDLDGDAAWVDSWKSIEAWVELSTDRWALIRSTRALHRKRRRK